MRIFNLRMVALALAGVAAGASMLACGDISGIGKQGLPAGTGDPATYKTEAGAIGLYNATVAVFQYMSADSLVEIGGSQSPAHRGVFADYILYTGVMTDELQAGNLDLANTGLDGGSFPFTYNPLDARQLSEGTFNGLTDDLYTELQGIRGGANMAIGMLSQYAPKMSPALTGHMYALLGYSEILLADLYCSGVPLSTLDFDGDFTYRAGSPTADVYRDAVKQFNMAIERSADSSRILNLARVGKGRAMLALGFPDSAALAVADVPDDFVYEFKVDWAPLFSAANNRRFSDNVTVSNGEGINGFPYVTDGAADPRVEAGVWASSFKYHVPLYIPVKYAAPTSTGDPAVGSIGTVAAVRVADGVEARLIRAEAKLAANDAPGWLGALNDLRSTVPGLAPLDDPGTPDARAALLFKERAYWLFLSGHRQGDMRRMIRQYHFDVRNVYPTDVYPFGTTIFRYGNDITAPIPTAERTNPLFTRCLSRGA